MPIFEYRCEDCKNLFEAIRPSNQADSAIPCEYCQSIQTKRLLSTFFSQTSDSTSPTSTKSGCSGCSGGNCATCH